jgi:hypothetical protein
MGIRVLAVVSAVAVVYVVLWLAFSDLSAVYVDGLIPRFFSAVPSSVCSGRKHMACFGNTFLAAGTTAFLFLRDPAGRVASFSRPSRPVRPSLRLREALGMTGGIHTLIPRMSFSGRLAFWEAMSPWSPLSFPRRALLPIHREDLSGAPAEEPEETAAWRECARFRIWPGYSVPCAPPPSRPP